MQKLLNKVQVIKKNSDYRVGDILFQRGPRWKHSLERVKTDKSFLNSVLYDYLANKKNSKHINRELFLNCLENFKNRNLDVIAPHDRELVIHLRMGDVVELPKRYLKKPYLKLIRNKLNLYPNLISKITIVTCFQYGEWDQSSLNLRTHQPLWNYTAEKNYKNQRALNNLIHKIKKEFNIEIDIFSNKEIDRDIYYCVFANFLITDKGGLDLLMKQLNKLRLSKN